MRRLLTLCLVLKEEQILLGMKKRGFGEGRWNGFGGKVAAGETIDAAARRELKEEVGLEAKELIPSGILEFTFASETDVLEVHIFRVEKFEGVPYETEEMRPKWFVKENLPFTEMWSDDEYWFPYFLNHQLFKGQFHFDQPASKETAAKIINYELNVVDKL